MQGLDMLLDTEGVCRMCIIVASRVGFKPPDAPRKAQEVKTVGRSERERGGFCEENGETCCAVAF